MNLPTIAAKNPAVLILQAGTYYWCRCGRSKNQPFCDGAHQGTQFAPLEFTVTENREVALCQCKCTGSPPYCDGSHQGLR